MVQGPPFPSATKVWHDRSYASIAPTRPELSAKGKNIVITGGGTGIGAETARHFAIAGAARIAIFGRREQPLKDTKAALEKEYPATEIFIESVDHTDRTGIDAAFANFLGTSKVDVVIANAAVTGPIEPVGAADPEWFMSAIQNNLAGNFNLAQAFVRHAAQGAVAIDVNSAGAHLAVMDGFTSYSVAKAAVWRLWEGVAVTRPDARIYHIQPGVVPTDMNKAAGGAKAMGYEDHVSLPASYNVWLASPESEFLKNKFLYTNWDVDELKSRAKEIRTSKELSLDIVGFPWGDAKWAPVWNDDRE